MRAELRIGGTPLMLADEFREMGYSSPTTLGGSPISLLLYVEDIDARFAKAWLQAGEKLCLSRINSTEIAEVHSQILSVMSGFPQVRRRKLA